MSIEFTQNSFGSTTGILAYPDHYVGKAVSILKNSALAVTVGTRKIVKAGTVFPANDATAIGVVFTDLDVTDGDGNVSVIIHGFVKKSALPVAVNALALPVLSQISFL